MKKTLALLLALTLLFCFTACGKSGKDGSKSQDSKYNEKNPEVVIERLVKMTNDNDCEAFLKLFPKQWFLLNCKTENPSKEALKELIIYFNTHMDENGKKILVKTSCDEIFSTTIYEKADNEVEFTKILEKTGMVNAYSLDKWGITTVAEIVCQFSQEFDNGDKANQKYSVIAGKINNVWYMLTLVDLERLD